MDASGGSRRPYVFAGLLLAVAGLLDVAGGIPMVNSNSFVVMDEGVPYLLDVTGFAWLHVAAGAVTAVAGLVLLARRRWTAALAAVMVVSSAAVDVLVLPYEPLRALLALGVHVAVVWFLVHNRLLLRRPG